jgi:lysophospholipase L1-like esterase
MAILTKKFSIVAVTGTADIVLSSITALLTPNVSKIYGPSTTTGGSRQGYTPGIGGTLSVLKPGFGYEIVSSGTAINWELPGVQVLYGTSTVIPDTDGSALANLTAAITDAYTQAIASASALDRDRSNHTGTQAVSSITGLSVVAVTGNYVDLTGKPTIPAAYTDAQAVVANAAAITTASTADRSRSNHTGTQTASTITGLAPVATSGSYADLTSKPTIPAAYTDAQAVSANAAAITAASTADRARANHTGTQAASTITGLATVATSGSYADLTNKPVIPAAYTDAQAVAAVSILASETRAYAARIATAGGHIDASTLNAIDNFIVRGKSAGWYATGKECWIPVGDFTASSVKLLSATDWTFNGFVADDYSQSAGYVLRDNTTKYISTGFVPDAQGLSSRNITLAFATTVDVKPSDFGRVVGTTTGESVFITHREGIVGVTNMQLQHSFGTGSTAFVASYGATKSRMFLNGTFQSEQNSVTTALPDEMSIYRSLRGNGMQYANGSLGFYWVGTELTKEQALDLNAAIMDLMAVLRASYKQDVLEAIGDSITSGSGADDTLARWSKIVARHLNLRERNNSQGSSHLTDDYSGFISVLNRYKPLLNTTASTVLLLAGTNDIAADLANDGNTAGALSFYYSIASMLINFQGTGKRVLVCAPPYRSDAAVSKMELYTSRAASIAKAYMQPFADFYHAFLDTGAPASLFTDGLHPNGEGHRLMANYAVLSLKGLAIRKPLIDVGAISPGASVDMPVTVYGAIVGVHVNLTLPSALEPGLLATAFVSADDTVTIRLTNISMSTIDPATARYVVQVSTGY